MINDKDADFYHENGYIVVDDVYSMTEVKAMRAVVEELVEKSRKVADHNDIYDLEPTHSADNPRVRRIKEPFKVHPLYREMVEHPNIISTMNKLIGVNQRLHGGKINIKAASFGSPVEWHQDWAFYPHTNDDVLAIGVMLDDMTEENGPLLIMPRSHKGPTYDHHADGFFAGAINPNDCPLDFSKAARVTGKAGACSFHHVRAVHGSEQNRSGKDRVLLLYQIAAADAWDLQRFNEPWAEYESRMIAGVSTLEPRLVQTPIRLPYPTAKHTGSIYENQRAMKSRFFDFDNNPDKLLEDAD